MTGHSESRLMICRKLIPFLVILVMTALTIEAQETNYDESKVPKYELPDPLVFSDGTPVKNRQDWTNKRRSEILQLFRDHVYGVMPDPIPKTKRIPAKIVNQAEIEIKIDPRSDSNDKVPIKLKD